MREQNNMIQPHLYLYVSPLPIESFCCGRSVDDDEFTPLSVVSLIFYALRRYLQTDIHIKATNRAQETRQQRCTRSERSRNGDRKDIFFLINIQFVYWFSFGCTKIITFTIYRIPILYTQYNLLYKYTFAYYIEYMYL